MKTGALLTIAITTLSACVVKTSSTPPPSTATTAPPPPAPSDTTAPPVTDTAPPTGRPDHEPFPGDGPPPADTPAADQRRLSADAARRPAIIGVKADATSPWVDLPLPAGSTSPVVVHAGSYSTGAFIAGHHRVAGVARRWIVLAPASGQLAAVDAGAGTLTAATPAASGSDLLLAGTGDRGVWYGRVSAAGRAAVEASFKGEVGGSEMYEVMPLGDGALLAGVHNPATSGESNGWLIAVDAAGKVRWEHRLGRGAYHALTGVALDRRGHVIAAGARKGATYQGWLVDLDKEGKVAGEQTITTKTWDTIAGIAVAGDEELYVAGKSSAHQDGDGVAVLARRASLTTETWRHQLLDKVVVVGPPIVHRASVELLVVTAKPRGGGTLHLVRAPRDGNKPTIVPVGGETFPLDWLMLPAWIIGTTDADTTVGQVRRAADGGVEWRTIKIARPR